MSTHRPLYERFTREEVGSVVSTPGKCCIYTVPCETRKFKLDRSWIALPQNVSATPIYVIAPATVVLNGISNRG